MTSAQSFSRLVGIGSLPHCLSGSSRMAAATSSTVSERKLTNVQPDGAEKNDGGGALSVNERTSATFASK